MHARVVNRQTDSNSSLVSQKTIEPCGNWCSYSSRINQHTTLNVRKRVGRWGGAEQEDGNTCKSMRRNAVEWLQINRNSWSNATILLFENPLNRIKPFALCSFHVDVEKNCQGIEWYHFLQTHHIQGIGRFPFLSHPHLNFFLREATVHIPRSNPYISHCVEGILFFSTLIIMI